MTALVWLREDLRLDDQPAIRAAAKQPSLYVYIVEDRPAGRPLGGASRWWLGRSLAAFAEVIAARGARLDILGGAPETLLPELAAHVDVFYWTRRYGAAEDALDAKLETALREAGKRVETFNGRLLREPGEVLGAAGQPVKVFTPYWKRSRQMGPFDPPHNAPRELTPAPWPKSALRPVKLDSLAFAPSKPDWSGGLGQAWTPGERGARERLKHFIGHTLADYADARDTLAGETTSRLSPHLRFGEISVRRVFAAAEAAAEEGAARRAVDKFQAELGWREFSYNVLAQQPDLATRNWSPRFDAFPWREDPAGLKAWERGRTGYPVVDAGMRELWTTGYMHNRVRLIAGSFLAKHLMLDWRAGERWFWDTLCDADEADNPSNWQWVAGSGADAAPYFRVFNPFLQGWKFDPKGEYVRRWVPELAKLEPKWIHAPWTAPPETLAAAGVTLGKNYPHPIVDHDQARARALQAFSSLTASDQRSSAARSSAKNAG